MISVWKRSLSLVLTAVFLFTALTGCDNASEQTDDTPWGGTVSTVDSGDVANDGELSLKWDNAEHTLMLFNKSGVAFGSTPKEEYGDPGLGRAQKKKLTSQINIEYIDPDTKKVEKLYSSADSVEDGRVSEKTIENGIELTYYFDTVNIVVPVSFTLKDGYLEVSVNTDNVKEKSYKLYSISFMPGLIACKNSEDAYLFLPDGTGALYGCSPKRENYKYNIPVYGTDISSLDVTKFRNTEYARLPVFGMSNKGKTLCGIITNGDEAAEINAETSNAVSGYSNAYVTFVVRGKTDVTVGSNFGGSEVVPTYSKYLAPNQKLTVRYYALGGKKRGYMQIAECYRSYLCNESGLKKKDNDKQLYLDFVMAATLREFAFGIPYDKINALTTCAQAKDILTGFTDKKVSVKLEGITDGGIEISSYAGNFRIEKTAGGKKALKSLVDWGQKNGITVYPDFDLIRYRKGIKGFRSAARSASTAKSLQYFYSPDTANKTARGYIWYLINPTLLDKAAARLSTTLKDYGIHSVSLETMTDMCYSDYRQVNTYASRDFGKRISAILKQLKKKNSVMGESANAYAAVMCDDIISSPVSSSEYYGESAKIPFYQIVFKGYIPMSGEALNLSDDYEKGLLTDASLGIGSLFTVTAEDTGKYLASSFASLSGGTFENNSERINSALQRNEEAFLAAENAEITDYMIIADGVTKTEFSSGNSIIANFGDKDYKYGKKTVPAGGYTVEKGDLNEEK